MAKQAKKAAVLYPITVNKKTSEVEKKQYVKDRTGQLTKELKFTFSEKMVGDILKAHQDGKTSVEGDDVPEAVTKAFTLVGSDFEAAAASVEARQKVLDDEFEAEKNKKEIQANKEKEVFEAAIVPVDDDEKEEFDALFTATGNGIVISDEATTEQIAQKLVSSLFINEATAWYVGDLGNALQDRGVEGVIDAICDKFDKSPKTVYRNMLIARNAPAAERNPNLSFTVYSELLAPRLANTPEADKKIKDKLVKEAVKKLAKGPLSAVDARAMADNARTTPTLDRGNKVSAKAKVADTSRYLVVDLDKDVEGDSFVTDDVSEDQIKKNFVIDFETKSYGQVKDGAIVWVAVPFRAKGDTTSLEPSAE